jgi:ABC-type amino acid transport substrate-binding protein
MISLRLAFAAIFIGLVFTSPSFANENILVFDRVIANKEIRCGYVAVPPHIIKDPNTGRLSGIIYDVMEEAGKLLDLKINWAEEVGFATMNPGLDAGRYDAICFGYWQNPTEAKLGYLGFSTPLYYMPVGAFVRVDDARFKQGLDPINDPDIRISSSDGMIASMIAQQDFPNAKVISLPNMTDVSQNLMEVITGKADVTFLAYRDGFRFEKMNPGKVRNIDIDQPVRVFPSTIAIPQNDRRFEVMLNTAFIQLLNGGQINRILKKYEEYPGAILPVAQPYVIKP